MKALITKSPSGVKYESKGLGDCVLFQHTRHLRGDEIKTSKDISFG
jgi:hypothetical protein